MSGTLRAMIWLLLSCVAPSEPTTRGPGRDDDTDVADTDTAGDVETVEVGADRELRGVWIATVSNINWPSSTSLSAGEQQAELIELLDVAQEAGLNAVFFQVRPEGDALYASDLEPWSRYLTGTQGKDPGWDPLAFAITEGHARNLEVHAWLNPYRAKANSGSTAVSPHMAVVHSEYAYVYGSYLWMDPGAGVVQDRLVDVVVDIVRRYDVDGIHFDDYFYPYPDDTDFPDDDTYAAYVAGGGDLARDDWRRDNVNTAVRRVSEAIAAERDDVRFGIAPFGIYRPGIPEGITGLDQYAEIFADPVEWTNQGWLDYLGPQLYWPSTQTAQAYEPLVEWWSALPSDGQYTFPGNYLSKLGTSSSWTVDEFRTQVALARARQDQGCQGQIWYNISPLVSDTDGIRGVFRDELYATPALSPVLVKAKGATLAAPTVSLDGTTAQVSHPGRIRAWGVYRSSGTEWTLDRYVPAATTSISLETGVWAISAVDTRGVESRGVVVRP